MDTYMTAFMSEYNEMINKVNKNNTFTWCSSKHTVCITPKGMKHGSTLVSKNWKTIINFLNGIADEVYGDALDFCIIFEDHRPKFAHVMN